MYIKINPFLGLEPNRHYTNSHSCTHYSHSHNAQRNCRYWHCRRSARLVSLTFLQPHSRISGDKSRCLSCHKARGFSFLLFARHPLTGRRGDMSCRLSAACTDGCAVFFPLAAGLRLAALAEKALSRTANIPSRRRARINRSHKTRSARAAIGTAAEAHGYTDAEVRLV